MSLNGSNRTNMWCTAQRECGINGPPHSSCSNVVDQYTNEKIDLNKLCKCHAPAVYATPPAADAAQAQPNWQLAQRGGGQQQAWHDGMEFQPAAGGQQTGSQYYQPPPAAAAAAAPDPRWQQPQPEGSFDDGQYHGDQAQPQWQQPAAAAQPVPPEPRWQEPADPDEEIRRLKEEIRQKREAERQARTAEN